MSSWHCLQVFGAKVRLHDEQCADVQHILMLGPASRGVWLICVQPRSSRGEISVDQFLLHVCQSMSVITRPGYQLCLMGQLIVTVSELSS